MVSRNRTHLNNVAGLLCFALAVAACACVSSCGREAAPPSESGIAFWHTLRGEYADLFAEFVREFNATGEHVELQYVGSYDDVFRKCSLAIRAETLPTLATAYESMVTEYLMHGAVADLDPFMSDPECGLDAAGVDDIFPVMLETNRYPLRGNRLHSFPFTKSVLMVYYNRDMLEAVGCETFPDTWEELLDVSRRIREEFGVPAYSLSVDASTFDAMVLSCGGKLISDDQKRTLFDTPAGRRVMQILATMAREKLLKTTQVGSYDDRIDFVNKRCAFHIRSSAHRPFIADLVGASFRWDMAVLPRAKEATDAPRTVLFGGNVCLFASTPAQERAAWEFLKFFASAPMTARWAARTGYLPVRASAVKEKALVDFFAKDPRNRRAFDALALAGSEPKAPGWQAVRRIIEQTVSDLVDGELTPEQAASRLDQAASAKLAHVQSR